MRLTALLVAFLAAVAVLAPAASAHGAPVPADYQARTLADDNDDCAGDGAVTPTGNCRGSHDLIALDLQEKDDGGGIVLVFRLSLNKAATYPVTDTITFQAGSGKTLAIRTTDDKSFSVASGFDSVGAPQSLNDGTRFTVDAFVMASSLGLNPGDQLTSFHVESKAGNNLGDYMPGGCKTNLGTECSGTDTSTRRDVPYTMRGTGYYAKVEAPSDTIQVPAGGDSAITQLTLTNSLSHSAQTLSLSLDGLNGVSGGFHAGEAVEGAEYTPTKEIALQGKQETVLHLRLHGNQEGASGTVTITMTTNLGGRVQAQIPYQVVPSGSVSSTPDGATPSTSASKGSPLPAAPLVGALLLGLALRRRS